MSKYYIDSFLDIMNLCFLGSRKTFKSMFNLDEEKIERVLFLAGQKGRERCLFFLRRDSRHLYVSWYFEIQTTRLIMFFVIHMYMFWHNNKDAFFQCCDSVSF